MLPLQGAWVRCLVRELRSHPRDCQVSSPTPQFKSIIFQHSAFFIVQLSYPYMTTRKTVVLTRWIFVGKVMSLLFNMLSRLVIAFFSQENASFNFMASVTICSDFGAPQNKICHCFHCFSIYLPSSLMIGETQLQTPRRDHFARVRLGLIAMSVHSRCWRSCGAKGTLLQGKLPQNRYQNKK